MALTEDEKKKLETYEVQVGQIEAGLKILENTPRQTTALGKLDTRGQAPDFNTFSDQDLKDIFALAKTNMDLNSIDQDLGYHHKFSSVNTMSLNPDTMSRGELEDFTRTILRVQNNHIPPYKVSNAQYIQMGSADRGFSAWSGKLRDDMAELKRTVEERDGPGSLENEAPGLEQRILDARTEVKRVAGEQALEGEKYQTLATRHSLEELRPNNGVKLSPRKIGDKIHEMTHAVGMTDEVKQDARGADLTGVDLSKSDLSRFEIDSATLVKAKGLDRVQGVDPKTLALARGEQRLAELQRQKTKLQNPSAGDRFKAFFNHGLKGVDGAIAKLDREVKATHIAMDETRKGISLSDRQDYVREMKSGIDRYKGELTVQSLDASFGAGEVQPPRPGMSNAEVKQTGKEIQEKFKTEMKVLSVRQKMEAESGGKPKVGQENKQGKSQNMGAKL